MDIQQPGKNADANSIIRLKHPTRKLPQIKTPKELFEQAEIFVDQEIDYETDLQRQAGIYNFVYASLILDKPEYAAKAAVISRDYDVPIDQVSSMAHRSGFGNTLMAAKFYQLLHDRGVCPDIEAAYACWYDLRDKLLSEDYDALTHDEFEILHDTRHFEELDLPSFAPHLEAIAERNSEKEDGTDYHFKLEPSLPRLPGGVTGVPVEIRENIYSYFFSDDDSERERDRMDPEKRLTPRVGYPNRNRVADHYLKEIGADWIFEAPEND